MQDLIKIQKYESLKLKRTEHQTEFVKIKTKKSDNKSTIENFKLISDSKKCNKLS